MNSISNSKQANRDQGYLLNIHIELLKARRKHPLFAHCLVSDRDKANAAIMLRNVRQTLHTEIESGNAAAVTVLLCEVCEAVDSLAKEDFKNALVELAQVCAVSIRTMEAIENEVKHKEADETPLVSVCEKYEPEKVPHPEEKDDD